MSMTNKKWSDLCYEVTTLGINVPFSATKQDLINILAAAKSTGPVLMQLPCQLAKDFTSLSSSQQEVVLKGGNYVMEVKFDGCRAKIHFGEEQNRIDTRNQCVETYCYTEKTNNFPHLLTPIKSLLGTIVDGEMIMPCETMVAGKTQTVDQLTSTAAVFNSQPKRARELQTRFGWMNYHLFDVLFYKGEDVRDQPFTERRQMVNEIVTIIYKTELLRAIKLSIVWDGRVIDIQEYYERMIAEGKEGAMLKSKYSSYSDKEGSRKQRVWYKWKRTDTIEGFITGYVPGQGKYDGLVGALLVSVFDSKNNTHEICSVAPGSDTSRRRLSSDGELADFAYMQVVEISYQQRTKNGRLRHPVLVKFRPELSYLTCKDPYFD